MTMFYRILETNKQLGAAILQVWDSTPSLKSVKELLTAAAASSRPSSSRVSPRDDYYDDEDMDTDLSLPVRRVVVDSQTCPVGWFVADSRSVQVMGAWRNSTEAQLSSNTPRSRL